MLTVTASLNSQGDENENENEDEDGDEGISHDSSASLTTGLKIYHVNTYVQGKPLQCIHL